MTYRVKTATAPIRRAVFDIDMTCLETETVPVSCMDVRIDKTRGADSHWKLPY